MTDVEQSIEQAASAQQAPAGVQSVEPQDASLTGASTGAQRELLGLNSQTKDGRRPEGQPAPETAPGQHATGSGPAVHKDGAAEKK